MRWLIAPAGLGILALLSFAAYRTFSDSAREVVVYVSVDQELAAPVLERFSVRTGIRVLPVYDSEATKTAGLAMRISSERARPRADLFWASEPTRMARLAREGALAAYDSPEAEGLPAWARRPFWTALSSRARVILVHKGEPFPLPTCLEDLTHPDWKGRICIADPRFGTTSAQAAVLGEQGLDLARKLKANGIRICPGNAMVRELVERGEMAAGLTDSDDAQSALDRGMPVEVVVPEDALLIPHAVGLVSGGPHPAEGRLLLDFLVSAEVERMLEAPPTRQAPLRGSRDQAPDWDALGETVEPAAQAFYEALRP